MSLHFSEMKCWEQVAREAKFRPGDMAALCSMSLRHLERLFSEHFQQTPKRWTRELRSDLARQLITLGWTNKAVAKELGFANPSHLCREFKELYGLRPGDFAPTLHGKLKRELLV